jgi:hypothetical protein
MSSELNKKFVKTVRVSGDGETRQRAFASALNNIRNEVIKDESQVTLQIIPKKSEYFTQKESLIKKSFCSSSLREPELITN